MRTLLIAVVAIAMLLSCTGCLGGGGKVVRPDFISMDATLEVTNWHDVLEYNGTAREYSRDQHRYVSLYEEACRLEADLAVMLHDSGIDVRSGANVTCYRSVERWREWSYSRRVLSELVLRKDRLANARRKMKNEEARVVTARLIETLARLVYGEIYELLETGRGKDELRDLMGFDGEVAEYVYEHTR